MYRDLNQKSSVILLTYIICCSGEKKENIGRNK